MAITTGTIEIEVFEDDVLIDVEETTVYTVETAADLEALFAEFGLAD